MLIYTAKDLHPNIQKFLPNISEENLFYKQHGLKHPAAIFNTSVGKIESSLRDFFTAYDLFVDAGFDNSKPNHTTGMLNRYRQFLYALREYLDDCFHVVKCFIKPPVRVRDERNQYLWLKFNAAAAVTDFFTDIEEYKKYLDNSVNELKHNNGILGSNSFYSDLYPEVCAGYFIANVVDGCYEPVEKIHEKFRGMDTGFSFRRDATYNVYNVYFVADAIQALLSTKLGINFSQISPRTQEVSENTRALFQRLMDLPRIHFPDEYLKPVPSVSLTKEGTLKLEYPSSLSIKPNRLEKGVLTHSTDGMTGKYRLLYAPPDSTS